MAITLKKYYQGQETIYQLDDSIQRILLGRASAPGEHLFDLAPDDRASRRHAIIQQDRGAYWIQDVSRHGTLVNDSKLDTEGEERRWLKLQDSIRVSDDTVILVAWLSAPEHEPDDPDPWIVTRFQAVHQTEILLDSDVTEIETLRRQLKTIEQISEALTTLTNVPSLLDTLIHHVYNLENVETCGVLLLDEQNNLETQPNYFLPLDRQPTYTTSKAKAALDDNQTQKLSLRSDDPTTSMAAQNILSAVYAPLIWQKEQFGVVFINNHNSLEAFSDSTARLLGAIAMQTAMFIKTQRLQARAREEEVLRSRLLQHFSPDVAEQILQDTESIRLGGRMVDQATVLASDIRGFTAMTQGMPADQVMLMLNTMFSQLAPIIFKYHGTVDKYVGDAILASFGSPKPDVDQCVHAIQAALEMQATMAELADFMQMEFGCMPQIGIAIHTGPLVHGYLGSENRLEYTVIGDTVNKTSRLCDKAPAGRIVISETVYQHVGSNIIDVDMEHPLADAKKHDAEDAIIGYVVREFKKY